MVLISKVLSYVLEFSSESTQAEKTQMNVDVDFSGAYFMKTTVFFAIPYFFIDANWVTIDRIFIHKTQYIPLLSFYSISAQVSLSFASLKVPHEDRAVLTWVGLQMDGSSFEY